MACVLFALCVSKTPCEANQKNARRVIEDIYERKMPSENKQSRVCTENFNLSNVQDNKRLGTHMDMDGARTTQFAEDLADHKEDLNDTHTEYDVFNI